MFVYLVVASVIGPSCISTRLCDNNFITQQLFKNTH